MDSFFEKILLKLTPAEIGNHIKTYLSLYLHPHKSWKKAISPRKDSFNFIVLHLIYYTVVLFIFMQNIFSAIQLVLVETVITLIPLSIFVIPFLLFTNIYKKKLHWSKLYRLILIIKLQFIPLFVILLLIAKKGNIESPYLIIDNLLYILWIVMIIITPVIIKLKYWQKAVWIFTNYISFLLGFLLIGFVLNQLFNDKQIIKSKLYMSPMMEYFYFQNQSSFFSEYVQDDKYLIIITKNNGSFYSKSQFVTKELELEFLKNSIDNNILKLYKYDSTKCINEGKIFTRDKYFKRDKNLVKLTQHKLDSFNTVAKKDLNTDLNLSFEMKNLARYSINREYFNAYYDYLKSYKNIFIDSCGCTKLKILKSNKVYDYLMIDENRKAIIFQIDSIYLEPFKSKMIKEKYHIEKTYKISGFLFQLLFYPLKLLPLKN